MYGGERLASRSDPLSPRGISSRYLLDSKLGGSLRVWALWRREVFYLYYWESNSDSSVVTVPFSLVVEPTSEVLSAETVKVTVLWNVTPCSLVGICRRLESQVNICEIILCHVPGDCNLLVSTRYIYLLCFVLVRDSHLCLISCS